MAKVIAPFKIQGTLDDLNFMVFPDGSNYVRMKSDKKMTSEEFKNNPIYDPIREQGKEMGYCAKKAKTFRLLAKQFTDRAKEVSSAGRINRLLLAVLSEDTQNPKGQRTLDQGLQSEDAVTFFVNFEANKTRPLNKVLKADYQLQDNQITLIVNPETQIEWPEEEAQQIHFALATSVWDYQNNTFETAYSQEITLPKENKDTTLTLTTQIPNLSGLTLTYFFVGFSSTIYKKNKPLHRKYNTTTIIQAHHTNKTETY